MPNTSWFSILSILKRKIEEIPIRYRITAFLVVAASFTLFKLRRKWFFRRVQLAGQPRPTMQLKNSVKNDKAVKEYAKHTYSESFALAVKQNRMTKERSEELLKKIEKVASNDLNSIQSIDSGFSINRDADIKLT